MAKSHSATAAPAAARDGRESEDEFSDGFDQSDDGDSSEDEDGENEEAETKAVATSHQNGRPTKKQRRQITAQEVQIARETAELFKSNIFKLQIDELVAELKLKEQHVTRIEKVLHRLHDCILAVPASDMLTLEEAEASLSGGRVAIAFPEPRPTKANYKFAYLPPQDVSLVGLFGLKTGISQPEGSSIDISLTMPELLFLPRDYLNYRALYKRSFYMAYLAEHLISTTRKNHLPVKISYRYLNDDVLCPVLNLESIRTDNDEDLSFHKTRFTINLLVALPFGVFDSKKLLPDRNCIRVQSENDDSLPPTPYYNSSLLSQTTYDYYLKFLYAKKKSAEAFKDACTLGRLWLQQRGFGSQISKGGFGHFEFAVLMGCLLAGGGASGNKILMHGFSSYQLFKATVNYLATMDLTLGYLSFTSQIGEGASCKYNAGAGFNTPTLFDKTVKLNLLWKMTSSSYHELQQCAVVTSNSLSDLVFDRFDDILLKKLSLDNLRYDLVYRFEVPDALQESFGTLEKISFITLDNYVKQKLYTVLKAALGERITSLVVTSEKTNSSFPLAKKKPAAQSKNFTVGVQLNAEECDKLVTKGPSDSEDAEVAKFKAFWGAKTSLRRFKDGTIQHCVVWTSERNEPLVSQIMEYALSVHVQPEASEYLQSIAKFFNQKLPVPLVQPANSSAVTSTANFAMAKSAFEGLSKIMYGLDLPLQIKSIMPCSASLRSTALLQPVPFAVSNPDFWCDVILQFESSSRWPDEIAAMEKTKAAFLLKMSELLNEESTYRAYLSQDTAIPFADIVLLHVLTPEGFGFRFRVLAERDEILYLRAVAQAGTQRALVQDIYLKFNQKYLGSIKHTRTIGILATSFPYYSPTVRLFKQWLDAHALLCHFTDELVELLALKPFVDPAPYSVPNSVEKGFLQVLNFIAGWNWKDQPLILDLVKRQEDDEFDKLSDRLTVQAHQVIQSNFEKIRKSDPSGMKTQLFVGTRDDPLGILWSNTVTLPIASRLTALARAALQLVKTQGVSAKNVQLMFTPAFKDFDFVIKTKNDLHKSSGVMRASEYRNLNSNMSFPENLASKFDLTHELAAQLENAFGQAVIFSTRRCPALFEDSVLCGVFVPSALTKKKFRVTLGLDVKPAGDDEVVLDKQDVLHQIRLLGGDLIKSVDVHKV